MIQFEWNLLLREMSDRCPFLRDILVAVAKCANKSRNHIPPICLCYAILLQQRNRDLNLVQRINTVLLSEGNAKKHVGKAVRVYWRKDAYCRELLQSSIITTIQNTKLSYIKFIFSSSL